MANKFNFRQVRDNMLQVRRELPVILANQAQNFFTDSWKKKGWDDGTVKPWALPRRMMGGGGYTKRAQTRNILVQTGRLRRAVSSSIRQRSFDKIRLVVDVPYAAIHNEGGIVQVPAMEKVLHFSKKGRFSKMAKANYAQKAVIPAHSVKIPKRQFMGDSRTLRGMQLKTINKTVNRIWQA